MLYHRAGGCQCWAQAWLSQGCEAHCADLRTVTNLTITSSGVKAIAFTGSNTDILKENVHQTKLKTPSKVNAPHGPDFYLWGKAEKLNSV